MSWNITDRFPDWGETGESPPDGFFYRGGDQVNEKHLDYLWNSIKEFEREVQSALNEIDSDGDGIVNKSDETKSFEVRSSDPSSPSDGQVWIIDN
jgi:hypothetical protein